VNYKPVWMVGVDSHRWLTTLIIVSETMMLISARKSDLY
jgi:hypothetical protein